MLTAVTGINWGDEGKGRVIDLLAEQADITPQHLYRIENEKVCPTILVVVNIAKALGVTLNDLLPL